MGAPRGEENGQAKLNAKAVREIRLRCIAGEDQTDIGERYGVTQKTVSATARRKSNCC